MDVHLVLKRDPSEGPTPVFQTSQAEPKIIFPKFNTTFDFKSISRQTDPIFEETAQPLITENFLKGVDSLLLSLGPTNSGKSFSLFQKDNSILEQALVTIFHNINDNLSDDISPIKKLYPNVTNATISNSNSSANDTLSNSQLYLTISMFELYNDTVIDLLNPTMKTDRNNLGIVTDPIDHKLTPRNISKFLVNSQNVAQEIVSKGLSMRKTFPTNANSQSSRSHCFIFFNLHKIYGDVLETTRFTIVDLAGLERSKSARTSGISLREASYTNGSLTELGRCLELISMNQFQSTCLRTNKLTRLVLNGYVKNHDPVKLLITLDPFGEEGLILQTLRYIDPIKYQDLQRKSLSSTNPQLRGKEREREREKLTLTNEIDHLRETQKSLKNKIQIFEADMMEREAKLRKEIYKENEQKLNGILMDHQLEITHLAEQHESQSNSKLKEQEELFLAKLEQLNTINKQKQIELDNLLQNLDTSKLELQEMKQKFDTLSVNYEELKNTSDLEIAKLLKRVEVSSMQHDSLNADIDSLNLKMADMQSEHLATITQLESEKNTIIQNLELKLEESNVSQQRMEEELNEIRDKLSIQNTEFANLEAEKVKLTEQINHLESNATNKESELISFQKQMESNSTIHEEAMRNKEEEISRLNEQMGMLEQKMKTELDTVQQEIIKRENEIVSLNTQIEQGNGNIEKLEQSKITALEELRTKLEQEYTVEIEQLKEQLVKSREELEIALNENNEVSAKIAAQKSDLSKELLEIKKELQNANSRIEQLNSDLKDRDAQISEMKDTLSSKSVESLKVEETLQKDLERLNNELRDEQKKNEAICAEMIALNKKLNENEAIRESSDDLLKAQLEEANRKLADSSAGMETLMNEKKEAEEELARLQMLCSDLKSNVSEKMKIVEKYSILKGKNKEYQAHISMIEKDKSQLINEVQNSAEEIRKLKSRISSFEKREAEMFKAHVNADMDHALSQTSTENHSIDKTPRETVNVLDTNPLDNSGLPPILSSPLRELPFEIHQDTPLESTKVISKSSPSKKKMKKEQRKDHEKMMDQQYATPKSNKKMYKALMNSKLSELNKKSSPSSSPKDGKLKKRKSSSSPLKPGKKRVRSSIGPEDSLEQLE